jgi:hypothetical protein
MKRRNINMGYYIRKSVNSNNIRRKEAGDIVINSLKRIRILRECKTEI